MKKPQSLKSFLKASTTEERYLSNYLAFTDTDPVCESGFSAFSGLTAGQVLQCHLLVGTIGRNTDCGMNLMEGRED